jgi:hypothetical protein
MVKLAEKPLSENERGELFARINPLTALQIYANLPEELRADPEIALYVVSRDELALLYTPPYSRTPEILARAEINKFARVYRQTDYVNLQAKPPLRLVA